MTLTLLSLLLRFGKRYGADLKAKNLDAAAEFERLDTDHSGDLSAAELEKFKQLGAIANVDEKFKELVPVGKHDV